MAAKTLAADCVALREETLKAKEESLGEIGAALERITNVGVPRDSAKNVQFYLMAKICNAKPDNV